jgi:hypothetical protein
MYPKTRSPKSVILIPPRREKNLSCFHSFRTTETLRCAQGDNRWEFPYEF